MSVGSIHLDLDLLVVGLTCTASLIFAGNVYFDLELHPIRLAYST